MLQAQLHALKVSQQCEGALVVWHPRLSEFPPQAREPAVSREAPLEPISEQDLREGEVHAGRLLRLTTISEAAVFCGSVTIVTVDEADVAVRLALHYFTADNGLARRRLPLGTRVCVKEPFFCIFPKGGAAVCCAQPDNLDISQPLLKEERQPPLAPRLKSLLVERQFSEALRCAEVLLAESPDNQIANFSRAEALVGLGRHAEAGRFLLQLDTPESKEMSKQVFQRVKEVAKGAYDFLSLHVADASGPERFPCETYTGAAARIEVRQTGNRGKGVFALDVFSPGELIMACKAESCIFHLDIEGKQLVQAPGWDEDGEDSMASTLIMQQLAKVLLSADTPELIARREALLGLSRGRYEYSTSSDEAFMLRLLQVVRTNRFSILGPWEGTVRGTGLWLAPSRLNHACDANCSWCTIGDMMFVRCQREVAAGDELCIAYCDPLGSLRDRRDFLKSQHGFTCLCGLCTAQQERQASIVQASVEEYHAAVARLAACEAAVPRDWAGVLQYRAAAYNVLCRREFCSLRQLQVEHAMAASAACCKLKKTDNAMAWLQKAKDAFVFQWGTNPGVFELYARERGAVV